MSKQDYQKLTDMGLDVATVAEIMGDDPFEERGADPVPVPEIEGALPFPEVGLHFNMPEDIYHSIEACSTSRIKKLSTSHMDCWADSLMNQNREEKDSKHFDYGKAIHCLSLEGESEYAKRYAPELEKSDYKNALFTIADIKHEIERLGEKPVTQTVKSAKKVPAKKEDWVGQLLHLDPEALIWEKIEADYRKQHEGKTFISAKIDRRVRIAARMMTEHEEIGPLLQSGFPEVSFFYYCPRTGAPMKGRFDRLLMRLVLDLKSFSNPTGMQIDRAITRQIANFRYNIQHAVYIDAVRELRRMIREKGTLGLVHVHGDADRKPIAEWCENWAKQDGAGRFLFVFQQSSMAPVTRGVMMQEGSLYSVTRSRVDEMKRQWVDCLQTFGTDPWVDLAPIRILDDEEIPEYATDIGRLPQ